jgi:hypothetical protein
MCLFNLKSTNMIRHTVVFNLENKENSKEALEFFDALKRLVAIPGVQKFECLRQIGKKNNFEFGLSMEFENAGQYQQYSNHPDHNLFVELYWVKEVKEFMEIDFEPLN